MTLLLDLIAEIAGLAATVAATLFMLLAMRNPLAPAWLKSEMAAQSVSLLLVVAYSGTIAWAMHGLSQAGIGFLPAALIVAAVMAVAGWLPWSLFHVGERLRHAAAGRSPFGPIKDRIFPTSQTTAHAR